MDNYFVYMLECSDESFYVGVTNDLERRYWEHKLGVHKTCYTYKRRPVRLVHCSSFQDVLQAIAWEKQLKGWRRAKKLALIEPDYTRIHELARCLNETAAMPRAPFDSAQGDNPFDSAQGDTTTS